MRLRAIRCLPSILDQIERAQRTPAGAQKRPTPPPLSASLPEAVSASP